MAIVSGTVALAQKKEKNIAPPPPPPEVIKKEIPPPPPPKVEMERFSSPDVADYKEFLKRNPTVKSIGWMENNHVRLHLKSGKEEVYDLNNEEQAKQLKTKYGELPAPPPPPPAPKAPKTKKQS